MTNKKVSISVAVIALFIITGFGLAMLIEPNPGMCTLMWCMPTEDMINESNGDIIEVPCNSCGTIKPRFVTGIVNVYEQCSSTEILLYQGEEYTDEKYYRENSCSLKIRMFQLS
ncbi:MAG: hypothetical protein ACMXYE_04715 [Candidatus Woesearchaeota archaeon]